MLIRQHGIVPACDHLWWWRLYTAKCIDYSIETSSAIPVHVRLYVMTRDIGSPQINACMNARLLFRLNPHLHHQMSHQISHYYTTCMYSSCALAARGGLKRCKSCCTCVFGNLLFCSFRMWRPQMPLHKGVFTQLDTVMCVSICASCAPTSNLRQRQLYSKGHVASCAPTQNVLYNYCAH